jgi:hypothetical protein
MVMRAADIRLRLGTADADRGIGPRDKEGARKAAERHIVFQRADVDVEAAGCASAAQWPRRRQRDRPLGKEDEDSIR